MNTQYLHVHPDLQTKNILHGTLILLFGIYIFYLIGENQKSVLNQESDMLRYMVLESVQVKRRCKNRWRKHLSDFTIGINLILSIVVKSGSESWTDEKWDWSNCITQQNLFIPAKLDVRVNIYSLYLDLFPSIHLHILNYYHIYQK